MLLDKVTLVQLIALNKKIKQVEEQYQNILFDSMGDNKRALLSTRHFINKAKVTFAYLNEESTFRTGSMDVDFLVSWYNDFLQEFNVELSGTWWQLVGLPEPELTHMSPITFGQFIDAKMIVDGGMKEGHDRWAIVQYLMAIFLVGKKRKYHYDFTHEGNNQFVRCGKMSVHKALIVSRWWEELNQYINANYTVFQDSGDVEDHTDNIKEHMQRWGWVNFLKNVAKTKAFDISGSGMNSIDCVRETKASEILVWASEEKEENIARSRDMKSAHKS